MNTNFIKTQQTRKNTRSQAVANQYQASNKESNISRRTQRRNKTFLKGFAA